MARKTLLQLVIAWSVVCASGLGVFLFEIFGPRFSIGADEQPYASPLLAIGFWIFLWAVPIAAIAIISRQWGE